MAAKVPLELLSKLPVREAMAAVLFAAPLALNTTHHALCPALAGPFLFPGFGAACAAQGLALQ